MDEGLKIGGRFIYVLYSLYNRTFTNIYVAEFAENTCIACQKVIGNLIF